MDAFLICELRQAANRSAAVGHITFDSANYTLKEKQKHVEKNLTAKESGRKVREALKPHYYVPMYTSVNFFSLQLNNNLCFAL